VSNNRNVIKNLLQRRAPVGTFDGSTLITLNRLHLWGFQTNFCRNNYLTRCCSLGHMNWRTLVF